MKTIVEIRFDAGRIIGGADAILGPSQCGNDVAKREEYTIDNFFEKRSGTEVEISLEDTDERVSKVLALLAQHGKEPWVNRDDVYTEDELQAAPLLVVHPWQGDLALGHATYDRSTGCPTCRTGRRQTEALSIIGRGAVRRIEKLRLAFTTQNDVLVQDVDVERLLAAHVTGALFWPVNDDTKDGITKELRRQQVFIEHVMPPMSPKSVLNRTRVCPDCRRGWYIPMRDYPSRFVYRREDLANIQDFNVTWEWFGEPPTQSAVGLGGGPKHPWVLVTPKVMNLLRGKTKKEAKRQGCWFVPIWIEDELHEKPYLQT